MADTLKLGILVAQGAHREAVIEDLRSRAESAARAEGKELVALAVCLDSPGLRDAVDGLELVVVPDAGGPLAPVLARLAGLPGPAGVAGRLVRDNAASRAFARQVRKRGQLVRALAACDVIVAADLTADRAVWSLRRRTRAWLVHGPMTMLHAIRRIARSGADGLAEARA